MADNQNITPDHQDRQFARLIGDALPDLSALRETSDALLISLFRYKESFATPSQINSDAIWSSIHSQISTNSGKAKILPFAPAIKKYAVAAAIIIAAFIGNFIYQNLTSPKLIGESLTSIQTVRLSDGSEVTLRPHSKLYKVENSKSKAVYELEGEGYFEITSNPSRVFSVKTEQSEVQVIGTKFILSEWGQTSAVYLQEGRIRYASLKNNQSVELQPGQSSIITESTETPEITATDEAVFTDWLNSKLVFQNEAVQNVFNELEQHFSIQIESPAIIADETLSGTVQLGELSSVLQDLELVLGGSFTKTGENSYVFNPN